MKAWNIQEMPEKASTPRLLKLGIKKQTTASLEPSTSQSVNEVIPLSQLKRDPQMQQ
jgi:hypothetical protein